ncbi:MAG: hypothetical protein QM715_07595 [Nibricoccus sp.]
MSLLPAISALVWVVGLIRALGACFTSLRFRRQGLTAMALLPCATVVLLAASGCTSLKVMTGQRIRLSETQVYPPLTAGLSQVGICPGGYAYMIATLKGPNGETLRTEGAGRGKILWEDLRVASSGVDATDDGRIHLSSDPRVSDGQTPHVVVTVQNRPELRAEFDVPIFYNTKFAANFSGHPGFSGRDGCNGADGTNGQPGSSDPQHPSPGGNGSNGTNGTDGENGEPGGDAASVIVKVTLKPGYPLLQIVVSGGGVDRYFLVDPQGGSLTVYADGGSGGAGGRGGRGGTGGLGGAGRPNGRNGMNGTNGRDGFSAPAGNGGAITVIYDPSAQPYLGTILLSSRNGPAPVFQQESLGPLW